MAELTQEVIDVVEGHTSKPEDIRQDFYFRWLEADDVPTFVNTHQLRRYVTSFLENLNRNEKQKDTNRARILRENAGELASALHERQDYASNPLEMAESAQEILIKSLSLSAVLRDTLTQYYVEGRSPEDIAEAGNENVEAVRKRITRARNILKGE